MARNCPLVEGAVFTITLVVILVNLLAERIYLLIAPQARGQ